MSEVPDLEHFFVLFQTYCEAFGKIPLRRALPQPPPYGLLACRATHSALADLLTQLSFTNSGTDGGILIVIVLHEEVLGG